MQKYYTVGTAGYQMAVSMAYDDLDRITRYAEGSFATAYDYLSMGMLGSSTTSYGSLQVSSDYAYDIASDEALTGRVSGFTSTVKYGSTTKSNTTYTYTYDAAGNITHIYLGGVLKYSYEYDNLNQLIRENNAVAGKTYLYTYDNAGNILSKKTFPYTSMATSSLASAPANSTYNYTYGNSNWGDQLTAYRGVPITYDSLGNPLHYSNGTSFSFTWSKGRQLTQATKGSTTFAFTYDADGRRTSKLSFSNRTVYYVWDGDTLVAEYVPGERTYTYLYDAEGSVVGFTYKDETGYYTGGSTYTYMYEKNLQGDIVGIIDSSGNKFVQYNYDAWGNLLSYTMLGSNLSSLHYNLTEDNPFRYRGYYFDRETGFYYLQSRYYDPVTGRFLNADSHVNANGDLTGFNMYAYCSNNHVMFEQKNISSRNSNSSHSLTSSLFLSDITSVSSRIDTITSTNLSLPGWVQPLVGAIPDIWLGIQYLGAKGIHTVFAYSTNTRYMYPIMGNTWRWFGKSGSLLANFGTVAQGTFRQILTGDAKAGLGAIAKSTGGVVALNAGVNLVFNLIENDFDLTDTEMWIDTGIDTAIGVSSYFLSAGTVSLGTAGLITGGAALPGFVVVSSVALLSLGIEWIIREVFDYHQ